MRAALWSGPLTIVISLQSTVDSLSSPAVFPFAIGNFTTSATKWPLAPLRGDVAAGTTEDRHVNAFLAQQAPEFPD